MRYYQDEDEAKALKKTGSIAGISATTIQLPDFVGMTKEGTKDLGSLFTNKVFPYPKPVELIKYIISIGTIGKENAIVLDFFAGSGTTSQALYKKLDNEQLSLFQVLLSNISYNVMIEIIYMMILIAYIFLSLILPIHMVKWLTAISVFFLIHILLVLMECVTQMYLTFWKNKE